MTRKVYGTGPDRIVVETSDDWRDRFPYQAVGFSRVPPASKIAAAFGARSRYLSGIGLTCSAPGCPKNRSPGLAKL